MFNKQKSRSSSGGNNSDFEVIVESHPKKKIEESMVKGSKDRLQKEELKEFFGEIKNKGQRIAEEAKVKEGGRAEFGGKLKGNENSLFVTSRSSSERQEEEEEESGGSSSNDDQIELVHKEKGEENKRKVENTLLSDDREGDKQKSGPRREIESKKSVSGNSSDASKYEDDNYNSESEKSDQNESKHMSKSSEEEQKEEDDKKILSGLEDHNRSETSEKDDYQENFEEDSSDHSKSPQKSNEKKSIADEKSENDLEASNQSSKSKLIKNSSHSKSPKSNSENYSEFDKNSSKSKESYSKTEKSEEKEEENYSEGNQEEYDQEFEETHPLRPINKSFEINLKVGTESKKKITYENISENNSQFIIKSSNPSLMSLKDEDLQINKGVKEKIQLIFAPIDSECVKKFYLYIDKDDEQWECLEIVVNYSN